MDLSLLVQDPSLSIFCQLILATLFGMVLGIERVLAGRTAGPRTYGLVSLGACLLTILSAKSIMVYNTTSADPYPMVGAIITGVGFIGAGLIIFHGSRLSGLTTAAGIWVSAAIGITVGYGFYLVSFFATFLVLFVFTIMWRIERFIRKYFAEEHDDQD